MGDTVAGLPLHPLVVHAVVVGVPVMALVTVVVSLRAPWRKRLGWFVVVANAALLGLVQLTAWAGGRLQESLGGETVAADHAEHGSRLWIFVLALLVASVVVAVAGHSRVIGTVAIVLALVGAGAATYGVVMAGDSGSRAVWENRVPVDG